MGLITFVELIIGAIACAGVFAAVLDAVAILIDVKNAADTGGAQIAPNANDYQDQNFRFQQRQHYNRQAGHISGDMGHFVLDANLAIPANQVTKASGSFIGSLFSTTMNWLKGNSPSIEEAGSAVLGGWTDLNQCTY